MKYEEIYTKKYDETFLKTEKEVKKYFLNEKKNDKTIINVNAAFDKIHTDINKLEIYENLKLRNLINIFKNTKNSYNTNGVQKSLENEVLENFNEIDKKELPDKYNFNLFVLNLAEHDALCETARLLQNSSSYYQLLYEFDKLDLFKIEKLEMHELKETTLYKELHKLKYPDEYIVRENMENEMDIEIGELKPFSLPYAIAMLDEIGFFKLDKIKNLTKESQYKIIATITCKDFGGTNLRSIKGNVSLLNDYSKENGEKYTSHTHKDNILKLLKELN